MDVSVVFVLSFLVFFFSMNSTTMARHVMDTRVAAPPQSGATFNVLSYGAVGDGRTDDSNAFLKAWEAACGAVGGSPVLLVPQGKTFLLKPLTFSGPCKSSQIEVSVLGDVIAPSAPEGWSSCEANSWILFNNIQGLHVSGSGKIDGQGSSWWGKTVSAGSECNRPTALRFRSCDGLQLNGLTHLNSPKNHVEVEASHNVEISHLTITAPEDSPNTDGIDVASCSNVFIHNCFIGTGDDCIAIKGNSSFINITSVTCGPGHGISVGGLGEFGEVNVVEQVYVRDCTLNGTTNGARIKTFQGGSGHVSGITFDGITLINSKHPIIIDQFYCDGKKTCTLSPRAVQVTDVTFRGIQGTSATNEAISLMCSDSVACTKLVFENIELSHVQRGLELTPRCENAHGIMIPPVVPNITCLSRLSI